MQQQPRYGENQAVRTAWRRAVDHIASVERKEGDERAASMVAADAIGISIRTLRNDLSGIPCPAERLLLLERKWGIDPKKLRPDLWEE